MILYGQPDNHIFSILDKPGVEDSVRFLDLVHYEVDPADFEEEAHGLESQLLGNLAERMLVEVGMRRNLLEFWVSSGLSSLASSSQQSIKWSLFRF